MGGRKGGIFPLGMQHRHSIFPSLFVMLFSMFAVQQLQVKCINLSVHSETILKGKYIPLKLKLKAKTKILHSNFVPLTFLLSCKIQFSKDFGYKVCMRITFLIQNASCNHKTFETGKEEFVTLQIN